MGTFLVRNINEKLQRAFRIVCSQQIPRISMNKKIQELMAEYIRKEVEAKNRKK